MAFTAAVYETSGVLFQPQSETGAKREGAQRLSSSQELELWRQRAEDMARKYQELLKNYRQMKAAQKEEHEQYRNNQKLLSDVLANCRNLELAIQAAKLNEASSPTVAALITGMQQVLDNQLAQLNEHGLLETVEPQPAEMPDPELHETVGSVASDLAEGLIAEVVEPGYTCSGKLVRKAKVFLAAPAGGPAADIHREAR